MGTPCMCRLLSVAMAELKTGCRPPIAHAAGMLGSTYRMRPGGSGSMYVTPLMSGKWNTAPFGGFVSAQHTGQVKIDQRRGQCTGTPAPQLSACGNWHHVSGCGSARL